MMLWHYNFSTNDGNSFYGGAGKTRCRVIIFIFHLFYPKHISQHYFNNLILRSLLRIWLVTPKILILNSLGFKRTTSGGVKEFNLVSETSINRFKAPIGIVPKLNRAPNF
jgi:hypothetical protein